MSENYVEGFSWGWKARMPPLKSLFRNRPVMTEEQRRASRTRWFGGIFPWGIVLLLVVAIAVLFYRSSARIWTLELDSPVSIEHPTFPGAFGPLLGAEFIEGNTVEPLINGVEIFPAMLEAIRQAERSITLESYIWASGEISDQFIEALSERARAGVKVHALVDGAGNFKLKLGDVDRMKEAGAEFVVYHRERWHDLKPNINHRTHRKLLVVDGAIGFTGGVCIDDGWLGDADLPERWRETHARITGPAVRQMQAIFAVNWLQTTSRLLAGPDYFPEIQPTGSASMHCFMSGPHERPELARLSYLLAISSARESIRLAHAYFIPDNHSIELLLAARARGVRIEVIVPFINDSRIGRGAARSRWGKLLEAGVEFHLYQPSLYHCKLMIVDDVFTTIGSINFDNRSFALNDEANINVLDASVARAFLKGFNADLARSQPLTLEAFRDRPFYIKIGDHLAGLLRSQL